MRRIVLYHNGSRVACPVLRAGARPTLPPGMTGVEFRGGFVNGSKSSLNYYTGFAVSGYTKRANRWVVGAEYLMKALRVSGCVPSPCAVHGRGRLLPEVPVRPFQDFVFLSVGGSALAGYETVNWGGRILYDGSRLLAKDAFVYGGAVTLELETYITDCIVLLASVRERALWGSSLGVFSTQFGLAVKFIIH